MAKRHSRELVLHDRQGSVFQVKFGAARRRAKVGYLEVRDGGVIWYPRQGQRGWTLSWTKLDVGVEDGPKWRPSYRTFDPRRNLSRTR